MLAPVQTSATSQGPAAGRHVSPAPPGLPVPTHTGEPPAQLTRPSSHGLGGVQLAPSTQPSTHVPAPSQLFPLPHGVPSGAKPSEGHATCVPSHVSATSQAPSAARHTVPAACTVSGGQAAWLPSHTSGTSQAPAAGRHTSPAAAKASGGHASLVPSHVSATSQGPAEARHTVPAGCPAHGRAASQSVPVTQMPPQQISPAPQRSRTTHSPSSHAASWQGPPVHDAGSHAPPSSGPPSGGGMPASILGTARQPASGSQNSPAAQRLGSPAAKHAPPTQRAAAQVAAGAGQSASAVHSAAHSSEPSAPHSGGTQRPAKHSVASGAPGAGHVTARQSRVRSTVMAWAPSMRTRTRRCARTPPDASINDAVTSYMP